MAFCHSFHWIIQKKTSRTKIKVENNEPMRADSPLQSEERDIILIERRGSAVVSTSAWHAAGRWFDSRTRHVSLLGVKTWLSTGIVYL